jgi:AraC-like DNA-binding protein
MALILIRDHHKRQSAILGAILALGAAAIGSFEYTLNWGALALEIPLNLICAAAPVAFWLLSKSLFEDSFRWRWSYLLVYAVFAGFGLIGHYLTFGDFRGMVHWVQRSPVSHNGLALLPLLSMGAILVALGMYHALKEWRVDLVESRRRTRVFSVLISGSIILFIAFVEFTHLGAPRSVLINTMVSGFFFLIILGIYLFALGFRREQSDRDDPLKAPLTASLTSSDGETETDPDGSLFIDELKRLMIEKRVFREEGLTIGRLAQRLGMKEYILRRMINGHLGYRNYNQFLNHYRIEEAAKLLLAAETRHLPVLSIALEVGYRSLTVFNKAFKEIMNMTPTEFRNQHKNRDPLAN